MRKVEFYFIATIMLLPMAVLNLSSYNPGRFIEYGIYALTLLLLPATVALIVSSIMMKGVRLQKIFMSITWLSIIMLGLVAKYAPPGLRPSSRYFGSNPFFHYPRLSVLILAGILLIGVVGGVIMMKRRMSRSDDKAGGLSRRFIVINLAVALLMVVSLSVMAAIRGCENLSGTCVYVFGACQSECELAGCRLAPVGESIDWAFSFGSVGESRYMSACTSVWELTDFEKGLDSSR
jgi:hypothetical protein